MDTRTIHIILGGIDKAIRKQLRDFLPTLEENYYSFNCGCFITKIDFPYVPDDLTFAAIHRRLTDLFSILNLNISRVSSTNSQIIITSVKRDVKEV